MNRQAQFIRALLLGVLSIYGCSSDDTDLSVASQADFGAHDHGVDIGQAPDSGQEVDASDMEDSELDASDPKDSEVDASDPEDTELDEILAALEADFEATVLSHANDRGWPLAVAGGYLFVVRDPSLTHVAGDHDAWSGSELEVAAGFSWVVLDVGPGNRYKFTDLADQWVADRWSRAYEYDEFGIISMTPPADAHLERFFAVGDSQLDPRDVRVWVPDGTVTHLVYVHDGQNLFDPEATFGGWRLQDAALPGLMMVGIDHTAERMAEYTHVADDLGGAVGGRGDAYADFVQDTVRPLIDHHYGEPDTVGVMGSSLGGLISLHIADRHAGEYDFVASLSGTLGWGSIGATNETIIERYRRAGHRPDLDIYLYVGGGATDCVDSDGDGIRDDDPSATDNFCENQQFFEELQQAGYTVDSDLWFRWEQGAPHNEAAWAAQVSRPLQIFSTLGD